MFYHLNNSILQFFKFDYSLASFGKIVFYEKKKMILNLYQIINAKCMMYKYSLDKLFFLGPLLASRYFSLL